METAVLFERISFCPICGGDLRPVQSAAQTKICANGHGEFYPAKNAFGQNVMAFEPTGRR